MRGQDMRRDRREVAHTWCLSLVILLIPASSLCPTQSAVVAQGTSKEGPPIEIAMELLFSRPVIRGTVNGQGPMAVLIDPQLKTSAIAPALADRLNFKQTRGASDAGRSFVELAFGLHKMPNVPVEIRDTTSFVPELSPASRPAVVLSLSTWQDQLVTIDYGRFQVRVESGALPEPNGRDIYALAHGSNELRVTPTIGGRAIDGKVDLLFPGTALLPESYVTELPLASKPTDAPPVRTREGAVKVREARLSESIALAGGNVDSAIVLFGNVERATLGYGALAQVSVTYDLARGRARLNRKQ